MADLQPAIWQGPFAAEIGWPPRTVQPGEEVLVTAADLESTHWKRKPKSSSSSSSSSSPSEKKADS